ncbi:MAG: type VI secretion system baseplate subunit TssE [Holosporaceae bacterium]|jgi:type VI secretion system lysozyme-like protein|nr:type VI secretion system baseplate subunit TssE [Holosporaceae bacterium]
MINTAAISLFEKLIDENSEELFENKNQRLLTFNQVQNSILKDLSYLLNTRVSLFWKDYGNKIPYSYGVNVTAPSSAENVFEIQELESKIDNVIKQFEPRLINAKSQLINSGNDPSSICVNIEASVILENREIPLSFPLVIDI